MRTLLASMCAFAAVFSAGSTQELPYRLIDAPKDEPLVRDMVFVIPHHDPVTEQVAFRVSSKFFDASDIPFFIGREGRVVSRESARSLVEDWLVVGDIALICDVPMGDGESLNLSDSSSRNEHCHAER
ncbi:MAG TPA: hypothetical protein VEA92_00120 [Candidatus Paceibacterota bacterium]|nr:hypothetical protein [Candidatus Paceibacterota bacterium]